MSTIVMHTRTSIRKLGTFILCVQFDHYFKYSSLANPRLREAYFEVDGHRTFRPSLVAQPSRLIFFSFLQQAPMLGYEPGIADSFYPVSHHGGLLNFS